MYIDEIMISEIPGATLYRGTNAYPDDQQCHTLRQAAKAEAYSRHLARARQIQVTVCPSTGTWVCFGTAEEKVRQRFQELVNAEMQILDREFFE